VARISPGQDLVGKDVGAGSLVVAKRFILEELAVRITSKSPPQLSLTANFGLNHQGH
jgi:hypothetical protein